MSKRCLTELWLEAIDNATEGRGVAIEEPEVRSRSVIYEGVKITNHSDGSISLKATNQFVDGKYKNLKDFEVEELLHSGWILGVLNLALAHSTRMADLTPGNAYEERISRIKIKIDGYS